jgi:hypothetical protein
MMISKGVVVVGRLEFLGCIVYLCKMATRAMQSRPALTTRTTVRAIVSELTPS